MKKKKAVIFDCDGVLFDSRDVNIQYYNRILARFHLPPMTEEEEGYVHMRTANESIHHLFRDTDHLNEALRFAGQADYSPFIDDMRIEPGLKELLSGLQPEFGLAVATNRSNTIGKVLERHGLDHFFDIVVSSLDVNHPKPHPESLTRIMDFFKIGPLESFYIGDSLVDYQTARAAGVVFIAYKNRDLATPYCADSMTDLAGLLSTSLP